MVKLNFNKLGGLIPAVVQDHQTDEVLMLAFMDEAAWRHTLETGLASFHSRTRNSLWVKGKTSGHIQRVKEIWVDCDEDTVLLKVEQVGGAACHTGHRSCFHKKLTAEGFEIVGRPVFNPGEVYKS